MSLQIESLIRENEILKHQNKRLIRNYKTMILKLNKLFKGLYPSIPQFQIQKISGSIESNIDAFIAHFTEKIRKYYTIQAQKFNTLLFKMDSHFQVKEIQQSMDLQSLIQRMVDELAASHNRSVKEIELLRQQFDGDRELIQSYEVKIDQLGLMIQTLEFAVSEKTFSIEKMIMERQAEHIQFQKLEKSQIKWKSRYQITKAELQELKKENIELYTAGIIKQ